LQVSKFAAKFRLLMAGQVIAAMAVNTDASLKLPPKAKSSKGDGDQEMDDIDELLYGEGNRGVPKPGGGPEVQTKEKTHHVSAQALMAQQDLFKEFNHAIPAAKCDNCGCHCPKIKFELDGQVFWVPLSEKSRRSNLALGVDPEAALMSLESEECKNLQGVGSRERTVGVLPHDLARERNTAISHTPAKMSDLEGGIKFLTAAEVRSHLKALHRVENEFFTLMFSWENSSLADELTPSRTSKVGLDTTVDPGMLFIQVGIYRGERDFGSKGCEWTEGRGV
jgi:hypothetical protein